MAEAVTRYLARLGLSGDLAPTVESLVELQRRHPGSAVPYENLAIMLGRPDSTDPRQTLERVAAGGNAGYCFHQNGAFEVALRALGFIGGAPLWSGARPFPRLNHLVLLLTIDGRRWWPDLRLGDALREPVEVIAGGVPAGPFRYEITGCQRGRRGGVLVSTRRRDPSPPSPCRSSGPTRPLR